MWLYKILIAFHFKLFCIAIRYKQHYEKFANGTIKNIEEEIPFEIPKTWCWCRLKDLAIYKKGPFGSSITKSMFVPKSDNSYKVYEQKNAIYKDITIGNYFISKEKYNELKSFEVFPNDIIVSCAGTIGESYILPQKIPKGIINQALMKITLYVKEMQCFYQYYFDMILKSKTNEDGKGSAMKNIPPFDILKKYLFPLPPLAEQERIVAKIEELFALVDKIEEEKQSLLKLIDKTKGKVLDLAMKGKLVEQDPNDDPASVLLEKIFEEKQKLAKEGKIKLSKDELLPPKISDDNDYYKKFKSTHIMNLGNVCFLTKPSIQEMEILPYLEVKYLRNQIPAKLINKGMFITPGSNIILVDGENSGEVFKTNENGYMGSTFMQLIIPQCINQNYVKYFINSKKSMLKNNKKGSAIPHLNKELFKILNIYLPSINEQNKIVLKLDNFNNLITMIKAELS